MKTVIVGAGPAGVTVAETLRARDKEAEIVVLSAEPYPPYSPPAMVDHFLTGSKAHLWRGESWPEEVGVEYHNGVEVTTLDPDERNLELSEGKPITYDRLVIATGSRLYAPLEGAEHPEVYNFKSLSAAEALIKKVEAGEAHTALIVGAGFIGVEIALLLRALELEVVLVEMLSQVMPRMLDENTALDTAQILLQRGVDLRLNTEATAFRGEKKIEGVEIAGGELLQADLYIAATGVKPNVEFLKGSGLEANWGIAVDNHLRTNLPDIFAAGDVVEAHDRITGESYVHAIFPNALAQGKVVGLNLAGHDVIYEGADRMNSLKHLNVPIMAVGLKEGDEVLQTRWNGNVRTIYLKDDRIVGFQLVGDLHPAGVFRSLMIRKENVRRVKDRLLNRTFGQGTAAWSALTVAAM
jgi:nitrite reductase (NADH) large subunit